MSPKSERIVSRVASVGIVLLLVMASGTATLLAWPRLSRALGLHASPATPVLAYAPGSAIDTPADWHANSDYTLVLFARHNCGACQNAVPYLKSLTRHLKGRAAVAFAGAGTEQAPNAEYAASIGIDPHAVYDAPTGVRARVTPTLVLVDKTGHVLGSWEGVGPKDHHARALLK